MSNEHEYDDPYNEYPPHSHQPHPDHANTCELCGALITRESD